MNDGGPAFPCAKPTGGIREDVDIESRTITMQPEYEHHAGMSLRDWFAGMAMQGIMGRTDLRMTTREEVSRQSYYQADAMLAERSKHDQR